MKIEQFSVKTRRQNNAQLSCSHSLFCVVLMMMIILSANKREREREYKADFNLYHYSTS